jgi:hypothetical protein
VLPRTRQLAGDMVEVGFFLRSGLPGLRWSWPWGAEVRVRAHFGVPVFHFLALIPIHLS